MSSEERESEKYDLAIGEVNREKEEKVNGFGEIGNADERDNSNTKGSLQISENGSQAMYTKFLCWIPKTVSKVMSLEKVKAINMNLSMEKASTMNLRIQINFKRTPLTRFFSAKLVRCNSSLVEVMSDSDPLFSEPLDIGNWFPDYVYESPVLDTNDELRYSLSKETICRDEVVIDKKICSNGLGKCKSYSSFGHDEQENKSASKDSHWSIIKENMQFSQEPNSSIYGVDSLFELNRADYQSLDSSKKLIDRKSSFRKSSAADKIDGKMTKKSLLEKKMQKMVYHNKEE
ncbi:hypothetical protein F3Y22_tig00111848pilonHSYRG00159 [Hibiscus syriacus]|uniref:Uncharacterized protein n=1 Tax=Hibiscus syriacus TaxID=106335 RepID=A0A6A2X9V7_HIBSY|nr:hypothetical protein F3Y22_tig00111848pilonHSYRG00159 [Hibiscus syriacus]